MRFFSILSGRPLDATQVGGLIDALRRLGVAAAHAAWDDPTVDWASFALTVVRSTWDYPERVAFTLTLRRAIGLEADDTEPLAWAL